jgi:hypothetical protein
LILDIHHVRFKVFKEQVHERQASSPPVLDTTSLNGKGRVSTAVYAKNLEMKLEEMQGAKKALELEIRAMKHEWQKGQGNSQDDGQQLQV